MTGRPGPTAGPSPARTTPRSANRRNSRDRRVVGSGGEPGAGVDGADGVDRVGFGGGLVLAVAQHPGEPERHPAGIAGLVCTPSKATSTTSSGRTRTTQPESSTASAPNRLVCQRSIASVSPLNVFPSITNPPAGSRAPRCRFDNQPVRRPCPRSTASTTRSRVCLGLTFSQPAPRRPASYGVDSDLTTTPSCPRSSAAANAAEASATVPATTRGTRTDSGTTFAIAAARSDPGASSRSAPST